MFDKIKVLVVDDSAFMRKVISDMINTQVDMQVLDTARDGEDAIEKVKKLNPDVITLDVEMPKKNGLEALKEIKNISKCEVIMLSSVTSEGSRITIESLRLGAFDFIQKPSGSISLDIDKVKEDLFEKIRYAKSHYRKVQNMSINKTARTEVNIQKPFSENNIVSAKIQAIVLGASTGGPRVLYDVITKFPGNIDIPIFVVQHMPAGFTKAFAERIDKNSPLRVIEAQNGDAIIANTVYIAPGGYHMYVDGKKIKLDQSPSIHGVRPAVDKLFISASSVYKSSLLGCIFTGMGRDGAEGTRIIKQNGGVTIAQDEATSTVYGMPKAAYETGLVDAVLPDYKISDGIVKIVRKV